MATIRDVADRAGVSVATVSHVINESRFVSPETKQRVLEAIEALHYSRDGIARSLRRNKTGTIGVIVSDITNPYFADLVRGVEQAIYSLDEKMNYLLCNTEEDTEKERLYLDVVREKRIDGLIIAPAGGNEDYLTSLAASDLPLVLVDRVLPRVNADCVIVDNKVWAARLTDHLLSLGHRRIVFLKATLKVASIDDRKAGFEDSLARHRVPRDGITVIESPSTIEDACRAGLKILGMEPMPDAVFCSNNFMTLGMMQAIHERAIACPDDIAVAGFDDFPWANSFRPRLTAVAQPSYEIGQEAMRLLVKRMSKTASDEPRTYILDAKLNIRESCGEELARRDPERPLKIAD